MNRQRDGECAAAIKLRRYRHGSTEPSHQGAYMGETNSLSRLVLRTRASKKVENALMVPGIDAAAIVGNFENGKTELGPAPNRDIAGNPRLQIFQRIVDQIRKNLFQREAVAGDFRKRFDADLGLGLGGLMRDGRDDGFDQLAGVDPHRFEFASSLAGEVEDRRYQAVHLGNRRFDEIQRLGKILQQLLVLGLQHRLDLDVAIADGRGRHQGADAAQRSDASEDVGSQLLQFAGEAHDIDQRRTQIVADDIGEPLDFVIGLAKIGGARVDGGFEIEVVVAQLGFGVVPRARRAPYQKDRDAGQGDHEAGAYDRD